MQHVILDDRTGEIVYLPKDNEECDSWFEENDENYVNHTHRDIQE